MIRTQRKRPSTSSTAPRFGREQRRALKKLAGAPRGVTEQVLVVAHGFSLEMLANLLLTKLAIVAIETMRARPGLMIEVERIRIASGGTPCEAKRPPGEGRPWCFGVSSRWPLKPAHRHALPIRACLTGGSLSSDSSHSGRMSATAESGHKATS